MGSSLCCENCGNCEHHAPNAPCLPTDPNQLLDELLDELGDWYFEYHPVGTTGEWRRFKEALIAKILEKFISKDEVVTAIGEPTHPYCDALNCQQLTSHRKEEGADQLRNELRKKLGLE